MARTWSRRSWFPASWSTWSSAAEAAAAHAGSTAGGPIPPLVTGSARRLRRVVTNPVSHVVGLGLGWPGALRTQPLGSRRLRGVLPAGGAAGLARPALRRAGGGNARERGGRRRADRGGAGWVGLAGRRGRHGPRVGRRVGVRGSGAEHERHRPRGRRRAAGRRLPAARGPAGAGRDRSGGRRDGGRRPAGDQPRGQGRRRPAGRRAAQGPADGGGGRCGAEHRLRGVRRLRRGAVGADQPQQRHGRAARHARRRRARDGAEDPRVPRTARRLLVGRRAGADLRDRAQAARGAARAGDGVSGGGAARTRGIALSRPRVAARLGAWRRVGADQAPRHPRQVTLAVVVAGLLLGPRAPAPAIAAVALLVAYGALALPAVRRPAAALALAALVLAAAWAGQSRTAALERTRLAPEIGHSLNAKATVLTPPRADAYGGQRVLVRLRGEPVLLRVPSWWLARARAQAPGAGGAPALRVGDIIRAEGTLRTPDLAAQAVHAHATLRVAALAASGRRRGG